MSSPIYALPNGRKKCAFEREVPKGKLIAEVEAELLAGLASTPWLEPIATTVRRSTITTVVLVAQEKEPQR